MFAIHLIQFGTSERVRESFDSVRDFIAFIFYFFIKHYKHYQLQLNV